MSCRIAYYQAGRRDSEITLARCEVIYDRISYRYDRAGRERFFLIRTGELNVVLRTDVQTHRQVEIGLRLAYKQRVTLKPLILGPLVSAVICRIQKGYHIAVTLLGDPSRIGHSNLDGEVHQAVGETYAVLEGHYRIILIRTRILFADINTRSGNI